MTRWEIGERVVVGGRLGILVKPLYARSLSDFGPLVVRQWPWGAAVYRYERGAERADFEAWPIAALEKAGRACARV